MAVIKEAWGEFGLNKPFNYFFFDEHFDQLYRADERFGDVFVLFAILAVCIACLGLLGLISFTAEQRTNEIGVRKVLSATVTDVTLLLSKDFLKLVLFTNIVAWPISWLVMNIWLQNFA